MISAVDLRDCAIIPALLRLAEYDKRMMSAAAVNLLLGTASQESFCGRWLRQIKGPALGAFQIEPATEQDVWTNYANFRPDLKTVLVEYLGYRDKNTALAADLIYGAMIARLVYWRSPEPLPAADDKEGQAKYWKAHFNSNKGRGTYYGFLDNYPMISDALMTEDGGTA